MAENPNAEQLNAIITSFEKPLRLSNQASARRLVFNIVERGWASFADSEDIFYTTDVRLDDIRHDIDVRAWCAMFDVPLVAVYLNPAPVPQFVAALAKDREAVDIVTHSFAQWRHKEIYQRALAFRREFWYDFVQWLSLTRRGSWQ